MDKDFDQAKGKIKQAAGVLTDDDKLRRQGENDEKAGKVKEVVETGKNKLDDAVDAVKDRLNK
jgi:uncharacterized protein YjbJ (UPF0337 family)